MNFFALENGQYLGEDGIADEETTVFKDVTGVYVGYNDGEGYYADIEFIIKGMGGNDANVGIESLTITTDEGSTPDETIKIAVFEKDGETLILRDFKAADDTAVDAIESIDESKHISETSAEFAECDGYFLVKADESETVIVIRVWIEGQHPACNMSNRKNSVNIHVVFTIREEG